jgi:general secretion pathway protein C
MGVDAFIKRYFWLVGVAVIVVCSSLAATAVAHVLAATALAESSDPKRPVVPRPAAAARQPGKQAAGTGVALVQRNIFCSECMPPVPVAQAGVEVDPNHPPATSLPLRLVATTVSPQGARSFATIRNTSSAQQGAYRVGDAIPGAGRVRRILATHVDFVNQASNQLERVSMVLNPTPAAKPPPPKPAPDKKAPRPTDKARDDLLALVDRGVRQLDENSYEVDRAVVNQVLANPTAAARGARIVPSVKDGKPSGFRLYRIKKDSAYARIGLKNGDTINSINGFELTSMDKALEVYTKVREASSLSVSITRRGKPVTLDYTIK